MPIGVLSRIPPSLSRGGTCKTNLRGAFDRGKAYDYARPTRVITAAADSGKISTAGAGPWANSVGWAHYSTNEDGDPSLTYPANASTSTSGTLLFRMYIQTRTNKAPQQYVFYNGTPGTDGYAVILETNDVAEPPEKNLFFYHMDDINGGDRFQLNSIPMNDNQWYQYSVKFETVTISALTVTTVTAYENGTQTVGALSFNTPILAPTGTTVVLASFHGRITDFAILDSLFSDTYLASFGSAPFI
jgi:hypothetical protein